MIAQTIPFISVEIALQLRTTFLLFLIVRCQFVVKKRQQILLRGFSAGERRQITRANVAPTPKSGSEFKIGNDLFQQWQIFAVDLILQRHVGGTHHQRFLLFAGNGDAGNQIRERFPNAGGGFNRQMSPFFSGQRFGDVRNHLPLRRTGNKVGDLFLKRLIPGGNLRFKRGG